MKLEIRKFLGFIVLMCISAMGFAETCSTVNQIQYKPSGSCSTVERKCCANKQWSEWGADCPSVFECDAAAKPSDKQSCGGGTQSRSVSCDTSTGNWKTGAWGECVCYAGYGKCNGVCNREPYYNDNLYGGGYGYSSSSEARSQCVSYCQNVTAKELVGGTGFANDVKCSGNTAPSQVCGCGAPVVCYTTSFNDVVRGGNKYYCECLLAEYRCP